MGSIELKDVQSVHREGDTIRWIIPNHDSGTGDGHLVEPMLTAGILESGVWPFELESRTARIMDGDEVIFEQPVDDVPAFWSDNAVNIVASKYFRGHMGTPERERSIIQLIHRVAHTITTWGCKDRYFVTQEQADNFYNELTFMLATQMFAFNSPVWFNVGTPGEEYPQCSACFINSVEDSMESIMSLAATEARLFKGGSGTGSNFSTLRGSKEQLSGGGYASGPVSFMKGYDAFAGVIKSGGKTRRAAKINILDADHPDVMEFIQCKAKEEQKAWALIEQGYDGTFTGEAYGSIAFQNANHSIRVSDQFMRTALEDGNWELKAVRTGAVIETTKAKDLLMEAAKAAHLCGDPGIQFTGAIDMWHTCKGTAPIHATNPCSEYVFLDDSACNLSSINLMKFLKKDTNAFDVDTFTHACRVIIMAQEILVDNSSYPTAKIALNSHDYRPLGLGYANLGALLMASGLPYDSKEGRDYAAAITALMTGAAYTMSAEIAKDRGAFNGYSVPGNKEAMTDVMSLHRTFAQQLDIGGNGVVGDPVAKAAIDAWDNAINIGFKYGFRNAQATVLAPTGTIAFMMDCDTTGIEPDIALVKYKRLVGGGVMKIVNGGVARAMRAMNYDEEQTALFLAHVEQHGTAEGLYLEGKDLAVFDCALRPANGTRSIAPLGHVKMMAAVQPFLSGAISKTVNVPKETTPEQIYDIYVQAWKMGLKAIAIYRDGSKVSQPLSTTKEGSDKKLGNKPTGPAEISEVAKSAAMPGRRKLPDERESKTTKFSVGGHDGYLTVGLYPDGTPGEVFLCMNKEGSTIAGLMDTIAVLTSLALQYGIPLETLVKRLSHTRFEPSGFTGNKDVPLAKSVVDFIFRYMGIKYLPNEATLSAESQEDQVKMYASKETVKDRTSDSPVCSQCGTIMRRSGSCYACEACGTSSGCG